METMSAVQEEVCPVARRDLAQDHIRSYKHTLTTAMTEELMTIVHMSIEHGIGATIPDLVMLIINILFHDDGDHGLERPGEALR